MSNYFNNVYGYVFYECKVHSVLRQIIYQITRWRHRRSAGRYRRYLYFWRSHSLHFSQVQTSKVDAIDDILGRCTKCRALSKLTKCPITTLAKVLVTDNGYDHTLTTFDPVLSQIVGSTTSQDDLERKLILLPWHRFRVTSRDVVFGAEKFGHDTASRADVDAKA